jgi:uncharacterized lipoprotein YbaY
MYARRFRAHSVFFGFGAIAAAAVIAGCTTPHGASPSTGGAHSGLVIRGSLGYAARIALPPEAEAIIEVRAASAEGALLAERRFALEGRQVPIPFELTVDRARLTATRVPVLRGTIRVAGRPDWLSPAVAVDRAAASIDVGTLMLTPARTDSVTRYLSCGEQSASLGGRDGATWLNVGARRFDLRAVAAASGAKYEAPGAAGTTLWDRAAAVSRDRQRAVLASADRRRSRHAAHDARTADRGGAAATDGRRRCTHLCGRRRPSSRHHDRRPDLR